MSEMEEQNNKTAQTQAKKDEKYDCFIEGENFAVHGDPAIGQLYHKSYFGHLEENKLLLEREEIVLLLERGRIKVFDEQGTEKKLNEIVSFFTFPDPSFWSKYLVYKDLRERGYLVRKAPSHFTTYKVYSRGTSPEETPAKKIVLPMIEGSSLGLEVLDMAVKMAVSGKKKLLLGVVDRVGDVTYYEASQLELSRNFP